MKQFRTDAIIAWLLLVIFGGLVIHAPLTVWLTAHGAPDWVKAWKEVLLFIAAVLIIGDMVHRKALSLFQDKLLWVIFGYTVLHIVVALAGTGSLHSVVMGLLIDLRYVGYAAVIYLFLRQYPGYRDSFVRVGIVGAVVVVGFALLQTIMPRDGLKYLGYSDMTIKPYILLDENPEYVRMNSTLRGPNPLGAYAMIVLLGVVAYGMAGGRRLKESAKAWLQLFLAVGAGVALVVSYSRSAVLGLAAGLAVVLAVHGRGLTRRQYGGIVAALLGLALLVYSVRDTALYKNIVLHDNPTTGAAYTSDQGHADSLSIGIAKMLQQPFGAGVGSTGSASLVGDAPLIIENQYLMIAHEVGWLGLGLFVTIWAWVLWRLWREHEGWFARMTLASGIGLAVIAMTWPVLSDDPIAMIWWGMAAVVLGSPTIMKGKRHGTAPHKKAA